MNITKKYLLDVCRRKCLSCDNARKLVSSHCTDTTCELFEVRKYQIDQSRQLTLFTYAGFMSEIEEILTFQSRSFLNEMYFSEIRKVIERIMTENHAKLPEGNALTSWWGKVASLILPRYGWIKNHTRKRRSPMRGDDYLYIRGAA
jgi:hypothetical protein